MAPHATRSLRVAAENAQRCVAKARWVPNPPSPSRLALGVFGRNAFVPIALTGPSALLGYDDASCMWDRATAE